VRVEVCVLAAPRGSGGWDDDGGGGIRGSARGGEVGGLLSMARPMVHRMPMEPRDPARRIGLGRWPRALRWNDGSDVERYEAVEAGPDGLLWYVWSHAAGGGRSGELRQSWEEFDASGPARPVPPGVLATLRSLRPA